MGQQFLEAFEIPVLGSREEAGRELLSLLARGVEAWTSLLHVAAGAGDELAGIWLACVEDLRDPVVRFVEHLVEKERGTLLGRQALEQDEKGERQRVGHLQAAGGIVVGARHERLRQPLPHIGLAPNPRGAKLIER